MDTTTHTPTEVQHLALKDAAARLGLNPVTLKRRANAKDLPAYRDGTGRWLFAVADLDAFRAKHMTPQPYVPPTES